MARLPQKFFLRKTETVARELLGKVLVREIDGQKISGMIVETEAYVGPQDRASHASHKKTARNAPMFETGGIWYIYLVYGFHHCINIVTEKKDYPAAVLIRALEPLENIRIPTSGPGKLCRALQIDRTLNQTKTKGKNSALYIEDHDTKISPKNIVRVKRIGVDYAGAWKDKLLRFYIKDNPHVSKK